MEGSECQVSWWRPQRCTEARLSAIRKTTGGDAVATFAKGDCSADSILISTQRINVANIRSFPNLLSLPILLVLFEFSPLKRRPPQIPSTLRQGYQRAATYLRDQNLPAAEQEFLKILQQDPKQAPALHQLGLLYFQTGRTLQGVEHLERAQALNPRDHNLSFDLALAYSRTKQFQKSIQLLESLNSPQARTADYYALLGANFLQLNDAPKTLENLRKAVAMDPQNPDYAYDLGFALNKNGNHSEALDLLKKSPVEVSSKRENCSGSWDELAGAGEFHRGGAEFSEGPATGTRAPQRYRLHLVSCMRARDSWRRPGTLLPERYSLEPANGLAHYKQGVTLLKLQRSDQAAEEFRRALSLEPELADAHYQLGKLAAASGQMSQAVAGLTKATELDPQHLEAYYQLGLAYQKLGERAKATAALKKFEQLKAAKTGSGTNPGRRSFAVAGRHVLQAPEDGRGRTSSRPARSPGRERSATAIAAWPAADRKRESARSFEAAGSRPPAASAKFCPGVWVGEHLPATAATR